LAIEGFCELLNIVYIAKKLYDMGKYKLVTEGFSNSLDYDLYFENMYGVIENLFEHHECRFYESKYLEFHVVSDPVIVDFYKLAGEYGRIHNISDDENPFIKEAEQQVHRWLNFSYCLDWILMGHTEPKRQYHSRIGLLISHEDYVDLACLAYGLIEIYKWFFDTCVELSRVLNAGTRGNVLILREEAMAA
jgi:hypothetical protein